jgi:hypothetical protein
MCFLRVLIYLLEAFSICFVFYSISSGSSSFSSEVSVFSSDSVEDNELPASPSPQHMPVPKSHHIQKHTKTMKKPE